MMNCNYLRKTHKERRLNESVKPKNFYLVRWNDYHSISVFDLLKFHQFGSTIIPETLLEYVWYAGGEVWKGALVVADLEQVDKNRRVRIPQRKAQREGDALAQIGDNSPKTADGQLKFIGGDQVLRTPTLTRYHPSSRRSSGKTFLENQTGFHHRPKQEVIGHQHSPYRDQRYPHQNCFEKYLGKVVMNLFNKQIYAVYYR